MIALTQNDQATLFKNYIDGQWSCVDGPRAFERRSPANLDDLIGRVPQTPKPDIARAVDAAGRAAASWRAIPAPVRGRMLLMAGRLLEERAPAVAAGITREAGKTLAESHEEIRLAVNVLEYMAGEGRRLSGETVPSERAGRFVYSIRQPLGVVGLITPWNFPLAVPLWKIAPALVCGNTIVWKPSRLTPLTSEAIVQLFIDAGLMPGALNVVNGAGAEAGIALTEHPAVRAISFTASFDVGTDIYSRAARTFKKVQCEAGGKNAAIVLSDADLDRAADDIVTGAFRYAGQRCTATSRVIALEPIADALVDRLVDRARAIVVGDGMDPNTTMGAIAEERQIERVLNFIRIGTLEAKLVCGGHRIGGPSHDRGLFVEPTIFDHVPPGSQIESEEIFGPVLSITRASDGRQAIDIANANRYGMVASVFGERTSQVWNAAESLECGIVQINAPTTSAEVHVPFGGIKDAGVGQREMGNAARDFFTELKVVYLNGAR